MIVSGLLLVWLGIIWEETNQSTKQENKMTNFDTTPTTPASGCVNAPALGLYRTGARAYRLGRKADGLLLPGEVSGDLDRARRCWHALSVLHTYAGDIIGSIESDPRADEVLADWARFTD